VGFLVSVVERVLVVVGPECVLCADLTGDVVGELRTEAKRVHMVSEVMRMTLRHIPVVLKIVNMHVAAAEASSGGEMEVTNDLVHAQASLNAATLVTLSVQLLAIMLAFTLLNALTTAKGPRSLGIGLANFVTSLTTSGLLSIGRRLSTIAATAVGGVEVVGGIIVEREGLGIDNSTSFALRLEADFVDTVHNSVLLLARNIHDIESQ